MAVRTAYDAVAGTALTATNLDRYPGGWIGYVEVTAAQTGITSIVDITSLTLTVTAGTSRRHRTMVSCDVLSTVSDDNVIVYITDGSNVARGRGSVITRLATFGITIHALAVETGFSGSTTRKARILRNTGTGSISVDASASYPAFILIEDIGPAA